MSDREAIDELNSQTEPGGIHEITHYLYVSNPKVAKKLAKQLSREGFATSTRRGALGESWLVLATDTVVVDESIILKQRRLMEAFAAKVGGEYDGWEAAAKPEGALH